MTKPIMLLGDSCVGTEPQHLKNLKRVVDLACKSVEARKLETGLFLGDQVMGYCEVDPLRVQWRDFQAGPIVDLRSRLKNFRHIASNHVCFDEASAEVYEEFCGPMEWTETIDGIQYIAINTAWPSRRGDAGIDCVALEERLAALDRSLPIVVLGHHPIWPVNGYDRDPLWVVPPAEGREAWALFRRYGVEIYACSHIIAFDVQLHDGLPQVCTGGAGTEYGPNGAMPGQVEGPHIVVVEGLGTPELRIDRIPATQTPAETWNLKRAEGSWHPAADGTDATLEGQGGYCISIENLEPFPIEFVAFADPEGPAVINLSVSETNIELALVPAAGDDPLLWRSTLPPIWKRANLFLQCWTGPGGVLLSFDEGKYSSMRTSASRGIEQFRKVSALESSHCRLTELPPRNDE